MERRWLHAAGGALRPFQRRRPNRRDSKIKRFHAACLDSGRPRTLCRAGRQRIGAAVPSKLMLRPPAKGAAVTHRKPATPKAAMSISPTRCSAPARVQLRPLRDFLGQGCLKEYSIRGQTEASYRNSAAMSVASV
jgi:hypothetical protein